MNAQETVWDAVVKRGYANGYNNEQFVARNIAKAQEELSEAAFYVYMPEGTSRSIIAAGTQAESDFDFFRDGEDWAIALHPIEATMFALAEELADVQVTLFAAAEALSNHMQDMGLGGFDLVNAAVAKSVRDIGRGVRVKEDI